MDFLADDSEYQRQPEYFSKHRTHSPICELWRFFPADDAARHWDITIYLTNSASRQKKYTYNDTVLPLAQASQIIR